MAIKPMGNGRELVEKLLEISESNWPQSYLHFKDDTFEFRCDFSNVLNFLPHEDLVRIYRDKYGYVSQAENWDAEEYLSVILSHSHTHCLMEEIKKLKKREFIPDFIYQILDEIFNTELEKQTQLDNSAARLINIAVIMDLVKTQKIEMTKANRTKFNQALENIKSALQPLISDFDEVTSRSYKNLGYFELDPFLKRITTDRLNKPDTDLTAIFRLGINNIYKDVFGPRFSKLSRLEKIIINGLAATGQAVDQSIFIISLLPDGDRANESAINQALAELIDKKAIQIENDKISIAGEEFIEWYKAISAPRRKRAQPTGLSAPHP